MKERGRIMNIKKLVASILIVAGTITTASANSIENKASDLGVTLSGHYIDETMKTKASTIRSAVSSLSRSPS